MKVLDIENVKIIGKNKKYIKGRNGQLILSKEYRDFKNMISMCCSKKMIDPPYRVDMCFKMYHDIDAPLQAILDGIKGHVITDDRDILSLNIVKVQGKRGQDGIIVVNVYHIDEI